MLSRRRNYGARTGRSVLKFCEESARNKILAKKPPKSGKLKNQEIRKMENLRANCFGCFPTKKQMRNYHIFQIVLWQKFWKPYVMQHRSTILVFILLLCLVWNFFESKKKTRTFFPSTEYARGAASWPARGKWQIYWKFL